MTTSPGYHDPSHPGNAPSYHTGKSCVEEGCERPAGTAWSPWWCQPCNVERMDRIGRNFRSLVERVVQKADAASESEESDHD